MRLLPGGVNVTRTGRVAGSGIEGGTSSPSASPAPPGSLTPSSCEDEPRGRSTAGPIRHLREAVNRLHGPPRNHPVLPPTSQTDGDPIR